MPVIKRLPVKVHLSFGMKFAIAKFDSRDCVSFTLNTTSKDKLSIVVYDTRGATLKAVEEYRANKLWKKMLEAVNVPALATISKSATQQNFVGILLETPIDSIIPGNLLALTAYSITEEKECEFSQVPNKGPFIWKYKFISLSGVPEEVVLTVTGPSCKVAIKPVSEIPRHEGMVFVFEEKVTMEDGKTFFPPN